MHPAFVNSYALRTPAGLAARSIPASARPATVLRKAVRAWSDAPLHTAVYTHGHADHAFGLRAFLAAGERPRDRRAGELRGALPPLRGACTAGTRASTSASSACRSRCSRSSFDWPTHATSATQLAHAARRPRRSTYDAAKGETDDALWVWVPERRYLFTGDLIIWQAPNCGNPQKVQRYPEDWADALEPWPGSTPSGCSPGHGLVVHGRGRGAHRC